MDKILDDILVLDFSEYIAGPYCGFLLSDLGAEVIKIEPPDGGEERRLGNPARYKGNTRMALTMNRGKKGICIDLRKEEGRQVVYRLVKKADVVIQNFAPGVAEKLGIDYDTLCAINKKIIFLSSTAFGETGPYKHRKGFDIIAHAASGVMAHYADEEGHPRGPGGTPYVDISTGILNALSIVSAIYARTKSGEGQKIETCLFNTGMALLASLMVKIESLDTEKHQKELDILETAHQEGKKHTQIIDAFAEMRLRYDQPDTSRPIEVPDCNHRPTDRHMFPYYRIYETGNGYIGIAALTAKQRETLSDVVGIPDQDAGVHLGAISDDIYYKQKEVMRNLEERFLEKTNNEWIEMLENAGVPCGQVNYTAHLYSDPQAQAMDMIWDLENSVLGPYKMFGHPARYSKTPVTPGKGAPTLGEDTVSVLEDFGFTKSELQELEAGAVVKQAK